MTKRNAWKVEPDLIDRFLNVLADNGFKWESGERLKHKPWHGIETVLFIEGPLRTITYALYRLHLNFQCEEFDITEVTEELLQEMEHEGVVSMRGDSMETLIRNVEEWAHEKGIADYKNWEKQFMKFQEEAIELHTEMVLYANHIYHVDKKDMKLEMGDVLVTLIVLAAQQDIELSECLSMAWNKIKDRRGKTINGQFVKEEDLEEKEHEDDI